MYYTVIDYIANTLYYCYYNELINYYIEGLNPLDLNNQKEVL